MGVSLASDRGRPSVASERTRRKGRRAGASIAPHLQDDARRTRRDTRSGPALDGAFYGRRRFPRLHYGAVGDRVTTADRERRSRSVSQNSRNPDGRVGTGRLGRFDPPDDERNPLRGGSSNFFRRKGEARKRERMQPQQEFYSPELSFLSARARRKLLAALLDVESWWGNRHQLHPRHPEHDELYVRTYAAFAGVLFPEIELTAELLEVTIPEMAAKTIVDCGWSEYATAQVSAVAQIQLDDDNSSDIDVFVRYDRKLGKNWIASRDFDGIVRTLRPAISKWKAAELRREEKPSLPDPQQRAPIPDFTGMERKKLYRKLNSPNQKEF